MRTKDLHAVHMAKVRATYHDVDQMGHVYYANYLVWFEIGRVELLRDLGHRYRDWEEVQGIMLPVKSCGIEYKRGAKYDEEVRIETRIRNLTKITVTFEYSIVSAETDELLAHGHTTHVFVTRNEGKVARAGHKLLPEFFTKES